MEDGLVGQLRVWLKQLLRAPRFAPSLPRHRFATDASWSCEDGGWPGASRRGHAMREVCLRLG
eukprot:705989-Lingulodinium_polyedra.AAC.1